MNFGDLLQSLPAKFYISEASFDLPSLFFFPALFSEKESGGMIDEDGCTTNIERGMSDRKKG